MYGGDNYIFQCRGAGLVREETKSAPQHYPPPQSALLAEVWVYTDSLEGLKSDTAESESWESDTTESMPKATIAFVWLGYHTRQWELHQCHVKHYFPVFSMRLYHMFVGISVRLKIIRHLMIIENVHIILWRRCLSCCSSHTKLDATLILMNTMAACAFFFISPAVKVVLHYKGRYLSS